MIQQKLVEYISNNPDIRVGDEFIIGKHGDNPQPRNIVSVGDKVDIQGKICRYITIDLYQKKLTNPPLKLKMRSRMNRDS